LTMPPSAPRSTLPRYTTLFRSELAAKGVGGLDHLLARDDLEDFPEILVVLHVLLGLAAHQDHWSHALVILRAIVDIADQRRDGLDRKSTRLNSSHVKISYAVFG